MKLAIGFETVGDELLAACINQDGGKSHCRAQHLQEEGIPAIETSASRKQEFELQSLTPTCFREYAAALGYRSDIDFRHTAWTWASNSHRVVIPTLVLARALIGSTAGRARTLFCDRAKVQDIPEVGQELDQSAGVACPVSRWLEISPSALQMDECLRDSALSGNLSTQLADAEVSGYLLGKVFGNNMYVTRLAVVSVLANDTLCTDTSDPGVPIIFPPPEPRRALGTLRTRLIAAPDGRIELSDSEWEFISKHLLRTARDSRPATALSRSYVDALIRRDVLRIPLAQCAAHHRVSLGAMCTKLGIWRRSEAWTHVTSFILEGRRT